MVKNFCYFKIDFINNVVPLEISYVPVLKVPLLADTSFVPFSYKINYSEHNVESVSV